MTITPEGPLECFLSPPFHASRHISVPIHSAIASHCTVTLICVRVIYAALYGNIREHRRRVMLVLMTKYYTGLRIGREHEPTDDIWAGEGPRCCMYDSEATNSKTPNPTDIRDATQHDDETSAAAPAWNSVCVFRVRAFLQARKNRSEHHPRAPPPQPQARRRDPGTADQRCR